MAKNLRGKVILTVMALSAAFGQKAYLDKKYDGAELNRSDDSLKLDAQEIIALQNKSFGGYDKDYRRLFLSSNWGHRGRNWQLIAQPALQPIENVKSLFYWNYAYHPYLYILRGAFHDSKYFRLLTNHTPTIESLPDSPALINLLGVRYLVCVHQDLQCKNPSFQFVSSFHKKTSSRNLKGYGTTAPNAKDRGLSGTYYLYEVKNPTKIAYFANSFAVDSMANIYKKIIDNSLVDHKTVLLEEDPNIIKYDDTDSQHDLATISEEKDSIIKLKTRSNHEQMLVLSYVFWPFWQAYIDGQKTKIYRAFGGFMSVKVPEGSHAVTFKYIPWDFYLGVLISFTTLLIGTLALLRRRKNEPKS